MTFTWKCAGTLTLGVPPHSRDAGSFGRRGLTAPVGTGPRRIHGGWPQCRLCRTFARPTRTSFTRRYSGRRRCACAAVHLTLRFARRHKRSWPDSRAPPCAWTRLWWGSRTSNGSEATSATCFTPMARVLRRHAPTNRAPAPTKPPPPGSSRAASSTGSADFVLVDHDNKKYEHITAGKDDQGKLEDRVNFSMNMPIRVAAPMVDKVAFNAKKSGLFGTPPYPSPHPRSARPSALAGCRPSHVRP